ncbi:hypothetical protein [Agreia sp. COWG]|uniref:nucleotide-binding protein n=1 Tax=Agreia sp. COWG TaxID=2773266 RepID=UPI0019290C9A|nr:hypothetical protein [Agreia sp. COWG]
MSEITSNSSEAAEIVFGRGPAHQSQVPEKATMGWQGFLSGLGIPVKPSAAEVAERVHRQTLLDNETTIRQATWTRAVSLLVANPKGGSGKTPIALLLAGVLAALRGNVVAVEVSDDPGKLLFRAEHERVPALGLGELVRDVDQITTAGQLAGYTAPQTTRAHVIGTPDRRRRAPLDGNAVEKITAKLDEFYSIRVMDSGNQYTSSAFRAAVQATDVLVIPIMGSGDSVTDALLLLDALKEDGGHPAQLARDAIVVRLVDGRTEHAQVLELAQTLLEQYGITEQLVVPYDQHIADREQITFDRLAEGTKEAFTALGAVAVRKLQEAVEPVLSVRQAPSRRRAPENTADVAAADAAAHVLIEPAPAHDAVEPKPVPVPLVSADGTSADLSTIFTGAGSASSFVEGTFPTAGPAKSADETRKENS